MEANASWNIVCHTMLDFIFKALAVGIMWLHKFFTLICTNDLISSDYFWKFDHTTPTQLLKETNPHNLLLL